MSIVSHEVKVSVQSATRMSVTYIFTDHLGQQHYTQRLDAINVDTDLEALSMYAPVEESLAEVEVLTALGNIAINMNPDKVAEHMPQADFDRRLLALIMQERDVHAFSAALPFFKAVESRGGANANQRATYLGVPREEYDLVSNRFGDVEGVQFFINDEKNNVWPETPDGWL